ncbi:MAG: hypothetical protein C0392_01580 [Syntrophus sp. (in: bacteria)]|nr:hypothetical protein [Syntrophus sp. (in: bacteria)]
MSEPNEREFFRIDDRLPIEFRQISHEEFVHLEHIIRGNPTHKPDKLFETLFLNDTISRTKSEGNELYAYLKLIDRKLDMILGLLGQQKTEGPYKNLFTQVDISGSGIKFTSDKPLREEGFVELKIALPLSPFVMILTLCQVIRAWEARENNRSVWEIALKFLVINDYDRDFLINYIFNRERAKLRETKETTG